MKFEDAISGAFRDVKGGMFHKTLTEVADKIAKDARDKTTGRIASAIEVGDVKSSDGVVSIKIKVNLDKAPEGRAKEFGSGKHGEKGARYLIEPKSAGALKFDWPSPKDPVAEDKGKIISKIGNTFTFRFVEHPGIEKEPYLIPSVRENLPIAKEKLGQNLVAILKTNFRSRQL